MWEIIGHHQYGTEEIDAFETLTEARDMLKEYRLAYRSSGWALSIRRAGG
jgi:hypothetical protein